MTYEPHESVYSSVVSRDSVRIAFTIASLNGLRVLADDVENAYLNAPTKECCYATAVPEFGEHYMVFVAQVPDGVITWLLRFDHWVSKVVLLIQMSG
jgi:hypothetical protein